MDVLTTDSLLLDNDKCIPLSFIVAHMYANYFQWVMYDHSFRWNVSCSPKWHLDYKFATPHIKPHAVAESYNMLGNNKSNWFIILDYYFFQLSVNTVHGKTVALARNFQNKSLKKQRDRFGLWYCEKMLVQVSARTWVLASVGYDEIYLLETWRGWGVAEDTCTPSNTLYTAQETSTNIWKWPV